MNKEAIPASGRTATDDSLKVERTEADSELSLARDSIEREADEAAQGARQQADEYLQEARALADSELAKVGATPGVRAAARAEQLHEDATHEVEREAVDEAIQQERSQRRDALENVLLQERAETDERLWSERARADDAFERILTELGEAVRLRDSFLSIASHELKTPLTPLTLRLESLARDAAKQPDSPFSRRVSSYIDTASRQVGKLAVLVAGLLDVPRITAGSATFEFEPIDLGEILRGLEARFRPRLLKAGSVLTLDMCGPVLGNWNALRFEQAVSHLLDNALKFGAGSPVRVDLKTTSAVARLSVTDHGPGIAEEDLERIFHRFERAVSDRHYGGLGLGLYRCRSTIQSMGGTLGVQSTLGQGATFVIELPLPELREPSAAHAEPSTSPSSAR